MVEPVTTIFIKIAPPFALSLLMGISKNSIFRSRKN